MAKLKYVLMLFAVLFLTLAAGSAQAQIVTIASGNGQLVCVAGCPEFTFDLLVVVVKDNNGNPLPNATVTWTVTSGAGTVDANITVTKTTDPSGQSSVQFQQPTPLGGVGFTVPFVQSTVTATAGSSTVMFTETTAGVNNGVSQVTVSTGTQVGTPFSGPAGQQTTTPLQIFVSSITGGGVPGVQVSVTPQQSGGPTVACAPVPGQAASAKPGTVLTDASGTATCNLIFGGKLGTGTFDVRVGTDTVGTVSFSYNFTVVVGPPSLIRVLRGDNQSGNPGARLAAPLVAEVDDAGGNPVSGAAVTWDVVQGSATLAAPTVTTSDSLGLVSTGVILGAGGAPVQVRVRLASSQAVQAVFNARVNVVITQLQKLSGDNQDAAQNTAFSQPLVVQVNNQGQPVAGVGVQFAVTSGSATVGTANAITDAQGRAQTTVQAGANVGPVVITATSGTFSVTFNLTVRPPGPSLTSSSFVDAAGFRSAISPCSLASIIASGLAPGIQGSVVAPLIGAWPTTLASVTVQFGGTLAPIYAVSNINGQESVTLEVPCELNPGPVSVTVNVGGGSRTVTVQLQAVSPGIFESAMSDGRRRAVLVRPDGSFVTLENPARRGEIIRMYITGAGQVTPPVGTNQVGLPDVDSVVTDLSRFVVGVNNAGVRVVSARYAHNLIGIYEVAFEVPADAPANNNSPLAVAIVVDNNLVFGNGSAMPIQ